MPMMCSSVSSSLQETLLPEYTRANCIFACIYLLFFWIIIYILLDLWIYGCRDMTCIPNSPKLCWEFLSNIRTKKEEESYGLLAFKVEIQTIYKTRAFPVMYSSLFNLILRWPVNICSLIYFFKMALIPWYKNLIRKKTLWLGIFLPCILKSIIWFNQLSNGLIIWKSLFYLSLQNLLHLFYPNLINNLSSLMSKHPKSFSSCCCNQ
jgi:hypothetical protein